MLGAIIASKEINVCKWWVIADKYPNWRKCVIIMKWLCHGVIVGQGKFKMCPSYHVVEDSVEHFLFFCNDCDIESNRTNMFNVVAQNDTQEVTMR